MNETTKGFTMIELIVVMTVITILFAVLFAAMRPFLRFTQARDGQRWGEIHALLNAVLFYRVDNGGNYPPGVTTKWQVLGTASAGCDFCGSLTASCLNLQGILTKRYLPAIPYDPLYGSSSISYYAVRATEEGLVEVRACASEIIENIDIVE
ncbi:MAG: type II secretion system protein [bacterium]